MCPRKKSSYPFDQLFHDSGPLVSLVERSVLAVRRLVELEVEAEEAGHVGDHVEAVAGIDDRSVGQELLVDERRFLAKKYSLYLIPVTLEPIL